MPDAHRATIYDVDTHIIATPDWISRLADRVQSWAQLGFDPARNGKEENE
jgi:hypothetical protein